VNEPVIAQFVACDSCMGVTQKNSGGFLVGCVPSANEEHAFLRRGASFFQAFVHLRWIIECTLGGKSRTVDQIKLFAHGRNYDRGMQDPLQAFMALPSTLIHCPHGKRSTPHSLRTCFRHDEAAAGLSTADRSLAATNADHNLTTVHKHYVFHDDPALALGAWKARVKTLTD
jgi:hypothetical protein